MPSSHPTPSPCQWFFRLASALDGRSAARLVRLFLGVVLARGRRTVTSWIRAAGLSGEFRPCYTTVAAAGQRADRIAGHLAGAAVRPLVADAGRLTFALDDTPTERYGPHVQGRASTTTRPPARPAVPTCTGTCGWCSVCSPPTRPGAWSPCRCSPGCTCGGRTWR